MIEWRTPLNQAASLFLVVFVGVVWLTIVSLDLERDLHGEM